MSAPYYIVSDNHFFMRNDQEEEDRRRKLFSVFEKIRGEKKGTLIIGGDFLTIGLNMIMPSQKVMRIYFKNLTN